MSLTLSRATTEYLRVQVSSDHDLTGDTVYLALIDGDGPPTVDQWITAVWEGSAARILVGPGTGSDYDLAPGRYAVWVKVTDTPEVPVRRAGLVDVT